MSTSELEKSRLWWHGPEWLTFPVDLWSNYNVPEVSTQTLDYLESKTNKSNKIYIATNFTEKCKIDLGSNECDNSPSELMRSIFVSPEVNLCDKLLCKIYREFGAFSERRHNYFFKICIN